MWKKKNKWDLGQSGSTDKDSICSMAFKEHLYIGKEDGTVLAYSEDLLYSFKAYDLKFDYLESCDVLERITSIERLNTGGVAHNLIVANERNIKIIEMRNSEGTKNTTQGILSNVYTSTVLKEFNNVHSYMINSLSLSRDCQFFISSDYLVVNLWRPERLDVGYTLLDIRPKRGDELVYVINVAKFSSHDSNIFGYSTTAGDVIINDIRLSSKSETVQSINCKDIASHDGALKSISDISFVDTNHICTRNLNSVSLFDLRNTKTEVYKVDICEKMFKTPDVYDTEAVYEKFKLCNNDKHIFTGDFEGRVYAIDIKDGRRDIIDLENENIEELVEKTKLVACKNDGFFCAHGDSVYEYSYEG
ncbi:Serine/threonine-protein phosphatase 2A 55 kDa regulatory subunit B delta isoform [Nosema granulosis]|uniref:Serine/threonine-protein phosphatase 2A 55 kDa regulatory subunit B delta isoform n=1 Tax=Nosema granulosis TaxID=83296 RepID=A0A9P6GWU4_9MICR|nr:Serine/threonine-protein phosphatase 2A 55 kDa regulatory subunit B delta isoform [Nosema granulosis]